MPPVYRAPAALPETRPARPAQAIVPLAERPIEAHATLPSAREAALLAQVTAVKPVEPDQRAAAAEAQNEGPTPVTVTIGRVEVRAVAPPEPKPAPEPAWAGPALSLSDYLQKQAGGPR